MMWWSVMPSTSTPAASRRAFAAAQRIDRIDAQRDVVDPRGRVRRRQRRRRRRRGRRRPCASRRHAEEDVDVRAVLAGARHDGRRGSRAPAAGRARLRRSARVSSQSRQRYAKWCRPRIGTKGSLIGRVGRAPKMHASRRRIYSSRRGRLRSGPNIFAMKTTARIPGMRLLHSPGPTRVPDEVVNAMARQPTDLADAAPSASSSPPASRA